MLQDGRGTHNVCADCSAANGFWFHKSKVSCAGHVIYACSPARIGVRLNARRGEAKHERTARNRHREWMQLRDTLQNARHVWQYSIVRWVQIYPAAFHARKLPWLKPNPFHPSRDTNSRHLAHFNASSTRCRCNSQVLIATTRGAIRTRALCGQQQVQAMPLPKITANNEAGDARTGLINSWAKQAGREIPLLLPHNNNNKCN